MPKSYSKEGNNASEYAINKQGYIRRTSLEHLRQLAGNPHNFRHTE